MLAEICHLVDIVGDGIFFLFGQFRTLSFAGFCQFVDKGIDKLARACGCEKVTDVINPLRVLLGSLIANFKFVLERVIGNNDVSLRVV